MGVGARKYPVCWRVRSKCVVPVLRITRSATGVAMPDCWRHCQEDLRTSRSTPNCTAGHEETGRRCDILRASLRGRVGCAHKPLSDTLIVSAVTECASVPYWQANSVIRVERSSRIAQLFGCLTHCPRPRRSCRGASVANDGGAARRTGPVSAARQRMLDTNFPEIMRMRRGRPWVGVQATLAPDGRRFNEGLGDIFHLPPMPFQSAPWRLMSRHWRTERAPC